MTDHADSIWKIADSMRGRGDRLDVANLGIRIVTIIPRHNPVNAFRGHDARSITAIPQT